MSLRPRYSLLTLLILTALVAGGVKLWYGPHHVVEERYPGKQFEYTYTRDWNGKRYFQGPSIIRIHDPNGLVLYSFVTYFTDDRQIPYYYTLKKQKNDSAERRLLSARFLDHINELQFLTSFEKLAFREAIEHERKTTDQDPGSGLAWSERLGGFHSPDERLRNDLSEWESWYEELADGPWE